MKLLKKLKKLFSGKKPARRKRRYPTFEGKSKPRGLERPVPPRKRRSRKKWLGRRSKRWLKRMVMAGLAIILALYITLPDIDSLNKFTKAPSILIKSEDGQIIGSFGDIYGDYVRFDNLPTSLVDAVLATEDRNFYYHFGIDPLGLARAMIANLRAGRVVQGGSTITQQIAKNVFLTPERSMLRKIREMMLAMKLEIRFPKKDLISIYLNRVYLGAGSYGVDAAAKRYFGKSAQELTLSESAIIAGLLKAPSRFAPTSNPELSKKRAEQVLLNMQDAGYLNKKQTDHALRALASSMNARQKTAQSSLYFADWIADQLPEFVGNVQEDLVVRSTLEPERQLMAEKAIAEVMDKDAEKLNAAQAALVSMTPDGAVRAMIGGRSYGASQFNRATQALRQPGSSFKLFVYLAGLESGFTPDTLVEDEPISIPIVGGTWYPKNYTGKYLGPIPLREAVAESINTVAVQVSQQAGLSHVINVARRMGITSDMDEVPAIALGATEVSLLEITGAYAHLAANGSMVKPYGIIAIETAKGRVLYQRKAPPSGMVLSPDVVGMMNEMLIGVVDHGTGMGARIGRPSAGKTGTTSDYRDAWFMGYTPDLVTGVWVGNDNNSAMKKVTGGMLPARIWRGFMQPALAGTPARSIPTSGIPGRLPWQQDLTENDSTPTPSKRDVELGDTFWNKLMD